MQVYRTHKGTWAGTQADVTRLNREEGSKAGTWRAIEVPTKKKASLIDFLNNGLSAPTPAPAATRRAPTPPDPRRGKDPRWRVYGGVHENMLVSNVRAPDGAAAIARVVDSLRVHRDPHWA